MHYKCYVVMFFISHLWFPVIKISISHSCCLDELIMTKLQPTICLSYTHTHTHAQTHLGSVSIKNRKIKIGHMTHFEFVNHNYNIT